MRTSKTGVVGSRDAEERRLGNGAIVPKSRDQEERRISGGAIAISRPPRDSEEARLQSGIGH